MTRNIWKHRVKFLETENIITHLRNSDVEFNEFVKNSMGVLTSILDPSKNGIDKQEDRTKDYRMYCRESEFKNVKLRLTFMGR